MTVNFHKLSQIIHHKNVGSTYSEWKYHVIFIVSLCVKRS